MAFSFKVTKNLMMSCHVLRRFAKHANPGLDNQIKAIEDAVEVIQSDPEGFQGLESDLFNVHKSHKEHELEQIRQRQKVKMHMIKNKYFRKEPLPNLLTYAEKEHIRYLHSTDQEEWTVEKLAESFPANAEVISKILKSHWSAISPKRMRLHDTNVIENWERFKNGEYKSIISKELDEHLKKFAERSESDIKTSKDLSETLPKKVWQKPISKEFSSILNTIKKPSIVGNGKTKLLKNKAKHLETAHINLNSDTYVQGHIKNRKSITIHELKSKQGILKTNDKQYVESSTSDQLSKQNNEDINETGIIANKTHAQICNTNDFNKKFELNEINITEFDSKRYGISETKQRIHIPRKLWRKGATYRSKNCYYDDDGELLYKVPGMI